MLITISPKGRRGKAHLGRVLVRRAVETQYKGARLTLHLDRRGRGRRGGVCGHGWGNAT
jgi:hypothetical protein